MRLRRRASRPIRTRARASGSPAVPSGATPSARAAPQPHPGAATASRRQQTRLWSTEGHQPYAPAAPHRERAEHVHDALGHVALEPVGGAERHRGRHIDREPGHEKPLWHLLADVGDARARRGRRIELAHVVTRLVGPELGELGARADPGAAVLSGHHSARPPHEGEVERLHECSRDGAGPLPGRRRYEERAAQAASASPSTGRRSGSGTASSTFSSRSSGCAFSLSPS